MVVRTFVTVTRRLNRVYRGNIALVGDASGSVDAITGEGLCLSFRQAIALADAMKTEELKKYQKAHETFAKQPHMIGQLLLMLDRYPSLRKRALKMLRDDSELFSRLLEIHRGENSSKFLAATGMRLGWQFLTA